MTQPGSTPTALRIERLYTASPERLYEAWTRPEWISRWFAPTPEHTVVVPIFEPEIGGRYRLEFHHSGGNVHIVEGVFRELTPGRRIAMTWGWVHREFPDDTLVTVELTPEGSGTRLVLTHEHLPTVEEQQHHGQGWIGCLARLDSIGEPIQ